MPQNDLDEIKEQAAKLLNQVPQGEPLGTELFNAISNHSIGIAFEGVCFKAINGKIYVYLTMRPKEEAYGGLWHVPGTFFRPMEDETDVAKRLCQKEYGEKFSSFHFCEDLFLPELRGGMYLARIYIIEFPGEPKPRVEGRWFNVNDLPENIVEHHRYSIIPIALNYFYLLLEASE